MVCGCSLIAVNDSSNNLIFRAVSATNPKLALHFSFVILSFSHQNTLLYKTNFMFILIIIPEGKDIDYNMQHIQCTQKRNQ